MTVEGGEQLPVHELRYSSLRELKERLLPCLSAEGLFVPCQVPFEPSTVLRFRFLLPDRFVLAEGTGVVVWSRTADPDHGLEPGMGVRFVVLPEASRAVIEQLVEEHVAAGGRAFDLDHLPGDGPVDDNVAEAGPAAAGHPLERERIRLTVRGEARLESSGGPVSPAPDRAHDHSGALEPVATGPTAASGAAAASPAARRAVELADDRLLDALRGRHPASFWIQAAAVLAVGAIAAGVVLWLFGRSAGPVPPGVAESGSSASDRASRSVAPGQQPDPVPTVGQAADPTAQRLPRSEPPGGALPVVPPQVERAVGGEGPALAAITWDLEADATVVTFELAGGLEPNDVELAPMVDPPRLLLRLPGVQGAFPELLLTVASPEVDQIRTWLHDELDPPELHVVLDLARDDVALAAADSRPGVLVLRLAR